MVELFDQKSIVNLPNPLARGEELCLSLKFIAKIDNISSTQLTVSALRDGAVMCEDNYEFFFGYTDLVGDNISIKFVSDSIEKNTANNTVKLTSIVDSFVEKEQGTNPYFDCLSFAKGV